MNDKLCMIFVTSPRITLRQEVCKFCVRNSLYPSDLEFMLMGMLRKQHVITGLCISVILVFPCMSTPFYTQIFDLVMICFPSQYDRTSTVNYSTPIHSAPITT